MINHLKRNNPIQGISKSLRQQIEAAQDCLFDLTYANAHDFIENIAADIGIKIKVPKKWAEEPPSSLVDVAFPDLLALWAELLQGSFPDHVIPNHVVNLAQHTQLLRAFSKPQDALDVVETRVQDVVDGFPTQAKQIECGKNRGDVIDPYIIAATQFLMCEGNFETAIGHIVAHKSLMMIEGLLGHLHEDVIGLMRGNVRIPEPKGNENKERLDAELNPFPGADVLQPPWSKRRGLRFHQIKSKTGSAKGGDGRRLGEQLQRLKDLYSGDIYYHALIGNTLVGHRSRSGVEKAAPEVVVLVGNASFTELTGTNYGPQLLLRVYQTAFQTVAFRSGYNISEMAVNIASEFQQRVAGDGRGYLEAILDSTVGGQVEEQDSRLFKRTKNAKKKPKRVKKKPKS